MTYGNFYVGKDGFLYKKMGAVGNRRNFSLGTMCNQPTDINNKYVSGSGVFGAVSSNNYAIRRKMIRNSGNCTNHNCSINYTYMGVPLGNSLQVFNSVPSEPIITSVVGGDGEVTIYFDPPTSDGGSTITSYTVTSSPGGFSATGSSSPITVTGLTNGTSYTFTVVATNSVGDSSPSTASSSVTPTAPTVPSAPTITGTTAGDGEVTITFTAPTSDGGSTILSYTVTSTPDSLTETVSYPATSITISGLVNHTAYTFTLVATNAVGDSPSSNTSASTTPLPVGTMTTSFTTVGTTSWTAPATTRSVTYLVVGGGGGGGAAYDTGGAGGGGGGMVLSGTISVTPGTTYSITVGDGGAGGVAAQTSNPSPPPSTIRTETNGSNGENSSFYTITALGGGFGYKSRGGYIPSPPASGTGGIQSTPSNASTGGIGGGSSHGGGGGGGANTNGASVPVGDDPGGAGGAGIPNSISGSAVIYGAGGIGGTANTNSGGNHAGGTSINNVGIGGNGAGAAAGDYKSGNKGGSGIVILQYEY